MIDAFKRASAARDHGGHPLSRLCPPGSASPRRGSHIGQAGGRSHHHGGADRVLTMDLHAPQIQGFFNIPVDHLVGAPILANYFRDLIGSKKEEYVVVSPDLGSVTRARNFAARLDWPAGHCGQAPAAGQRLRGDEHHRRRTG